jgi:antitoxin MazE
VRRVFCVVKSSTSIVYNCIYKVYTHNMKTKIQKWGNSLGVRLPKSIADQKNLKEGVGVSVVIKNDQIVIVPVAEELTLDSMLKLITTDNLHEEADWSDTRGREIW